jgi:hypothetical protein
MTSCRYVHHFLAGGDPRVQKVVMLGFLLSGAAFASLFVLAQFSYRFERFAAHFTLVLTGLLVHECSF